MSTETKTARKDTTAPAGKAPKRKAAAKKSGGKAVTGRSEKSSVAVVGGGISGIAAAIKLLRAGFDVTIFEARERLGGNTSSTRIDGVEHDVYPHMFCDWYANFWDLFENELGLDREKNFEPREGVKMRAQGSHKYVELLNPTTLEAIIRNVQSGAMSPAEMLLVGYSMLDLAGYPFNREGYGQLDKQSVNGFLYSGSTSTEEVAEMQNYMLEVIWSIQAERTSAASYQDFVRHTLTFPNGAPFAWMLRDSLQDGLIAPAEALLKKLGAKVELNCSVEAVHYEADRPHLRWRKTGGKAAKGADFDAVVLAVTHDPLTRLVLGEDGMPQGSRIIDREPSLAQLRRLSSVAIPVVDVYLKRKLADFPKENIGLTAAQYGLSVVDISQLWQSRDFGGKTALVIAASDGEALPGHDFAARRWAMLEELARFYPEIDIGKEWGDPDCDIDWGKTHARANDDYALFLNDVASWDWRPDTAYPASLPGVFFAGDLSRGNVDMATVEGAVESGVRAAAAIQHFDAESRGGAMRGKPIEIARHVTYGDTAFRAAKLAMMPIAYGAKAWAQIGPAPDDRKLANFGNSLQSEHLPLLPLQYVVDWWTTAYWFWQAALSPDGGETPLGPSDHSDDDFIDLGAAILMVLGEFASYASEHCLRPDAVAKAGETAEDGFAAAGSIARAAGRIFAGTLSKAGTPRTDSYKRRWRPKR